MNGRPRIVWKGEAPLASGSFADVYLGQWGLEPVGPLEKHYRESVIQRSPQVAIKSFKLKSDIDNVCILSILLLFFPILRLTLRHRRCRSRTLVLKMHRLKSIHLKRIESEVEVWSTLKSGHVVPLWATAGKQDDMSVLVMPFYTNGTLEDFLGKKENRNADSLALRLQLVRYCVHPYYSNVH